MSTTKRFRPGLRRAIRALLPAAAVLTLLLAGLPSGVHAQIDGSLVADYVERSDEILEQCAERVTDYGDERSRTIMETARQMQQKARLLLEDDRLRGAFDASKRARETALHAVQVAQTEQNFEERALQRFERAIEVREALVEQAGEADNGPAQRFLREAERLLNKARDQFGQRRFEMSFRLVESAESALRRAARLLFESGGEASLERLLERTHHLVQRVGDELGDDASSEARDLHERAEQNLRRAERAFREQRPLVAVQLARRARHLAGRAATLVGSGPQSADVQRQIDRWDERAGVLGDRAGESGIEIALRKMADARDSRDRAQALLVDGDTEGALRRIRVAHDLLSAAEALLR